MYIPFSKHTHPATVTDRHQGAEKMPWVAVPTRHTFKVPQRATASIKLPLVERTIVSYAGDISVDESSAVKEVRAPPC